MIYLDTHVLAWLYGGRVDLLGERARKLINEEELLISPMVALEIEYLFEIGRLATGSASVLQALQAQLGITVCDLPFSSVIECARAQTWTRDPFDRVIVGQAAARDRPLLTKDEHTRRHYENAIW